MSVAAIGLTKMALRGNTPLPRAERERLARARQPRKGSMTTSLEKVQLRHHSKKNRFNDDIALGSILRRRARARGLPARAEVYLHLQCQGLPTRAPSYARRFLWRPRSSSNDPSACVPWTSQRRQGSTRTCRTSKSVDFWLLSRRRARREEHSQMKRGIRDT